MGNQANQVHTGLFSLVQLYAGQCRTEESTLLEGYNLLNKEHLKKYNNISMYLFQHKHALIDSRCEGCRSEAVHTCR